jgi:hypothetical protein
MATTHELPEDLVEKIHDRASREGRQFAETMTDLLRKALAESEMAAPPEAMLDARKRLADKFISGEWGADLAEFEAARRDDRERSRV